MLRTVASIPVNQYQQALTEYIRTFSNHTPLVVVGQSGLGKTDILRKYCRKHNKNLVQLLPDGTEVENKYNPNRELEHGCSGILFFDNIDTLWDATELKHRLTQMICSEWVSKGKYHNMGLLVICRDESVPFISSILSDKAIYFRLQYSHQMFLSHLKTLAFDRYLIDFFSSEQKLRDITSKVVADRTRVARGDIVPTPRDWVTALQLVSNTQTDVLKNQVLISMLRSILGDFPAYLLLEHIRNNGDNDSRMILPDNMVRSLPDSIGEQLCLAKPESYSEDDEYNYEVDYE